MLLLFQCIVKCRLDKDTIFPVPAHRLYPMFTIFGSHKNNHIVVVPATVGHADSSAPWSRQHALTECFGTSAAAGFRSKYLRLRVQRV